MTELNQQSTHQQYKHNALTHKHLCICFGSVLQWVSNYRFGLFLKIAEHALDVFEVRGKRSIMKGKIPLPGCAALWHKNRHLETVCRTTQRQVKYIFSYFNQKCSISERPSIQVILKTSSISLSHLHFQWETLTHRQIYSSINTPEGI